MKKVKEIYYHCSCGTELTVSANDKVIALRNYVCVNCGQMLVADVNYEEVKEESLEDKFFDRMSDAIMDLSLTSMDDLLKEAEKRCIAFVAAYQLNEDKERKNGFTTWNGKGAWSDNVFLSDVLHHEIINKMDKTDDES